MGVHKAIAAVAQRAPLELIERETPAARGSSVLIKVEWVSATPLNLHVADGGLLVDGWPKIMSGDVAGTVVSVGPEVKHFAVGDAVFGYGFAGPDQRSWQQYVLQDENELALLPPNVTMEQALTIPTSFVTAMHTLVTDLGFTFPWPRPADYTPPTDEPVLVWGGASTTGHVVLQVLRYFGYRRVIAVASRKHHTVLRGLGATSTYDYHDADVVAQLRRDFGRIPTFLDCIGSRAGSLAPIAALAEHGSKVAVLLPVVVRDASTEEAPLLAMDPLPEAEWKEGVVVAGVRTHFYQRNKFHAEKLQRELMPLLVSGGDVVPSPVRVVEGRDMLERGNRVLQLFRLKKVSGEKLVFRINHP